MDTIISTNRKFNRMFANILSIVVILAMAFPVTSVAYAASKPLFLGQWQALDVDGSDMGLSIGGRPTGPFQITWTDDYISYCGGEAGIVRGTGWLNEGNSNLLEADVHLKCFTTGATLDFHVTFRYHPTSNTLSVKWIFGQVTIWRRLGNPQAMPPTLNLRVNYGHDWVESFYEGGHTAWVTVTDADGNVKATSELMTEPKDYWGGETGFQSLDGVWFDADGNQMENPPDILPNDWVYGWVANGASAQVQIGDIGGMIDLTNDSIGGTIYAPWFTGPVQVECLDWGSGQNPPFDNKDGGLVLTNGSESYFCSWAGEWDIQPGENVGVGYLGPDGHWVANAFYVPQLVLYIHYEYPDVVEGSYELGHTVQVTIFDSEWNTKATATVETMEMPHWGGAPGFRVEQWDGMEGPPDIQPGDVVRAVVDDSLLTTEARIGEIAATIDLDGNSITGSINAPWAGDIVNVLCMPWGAPESASDKETTVTPDGISEFTCSWDSEWDIQPGQNVGVAYWGNDLHWVANAFLIPMPTFVAYLPYAIEGYDWPMGDEVKIFINGVEFPVTSISEQRPGFPEGSTRVLFDVGGGGISLQAGDHIVMTDEVAGLTKEVWVTNLAVTDFDLSSGKVFGTYDPAYDLWAWLYDLEGQVPETHPGSGTWIATFTEPPLGAWGGATQWDIDGDGTSIDFQLPGGSVGNFLIEWSQTNPEEVVYLSWNGSDNLVNTGVNPWCSGALEFFGNSWVSENEGTGQFFFASLVGWGTTGTWSSTTGTAVNIGSISSGCPGSADIPINTQYQFFEGKPDLMMIQRTFEFGDVPYTHDVRPFISRLYPWNGFTQVLHPNATSDALATETGSSVCDFGCVAGSWDGSWFAIHDPVTGQGMIVQSLADPIALWLDNDGASFTNSSSILLLQPADGFTGTVTETEYLCFYNSATWTPSLTLPEGCQP